MLNEEIKQTILNGAYAVSRNGMKCKFIGHSLNIDDYTHTFMYLNEDGLIYSMMKLNSNFKSYEKMESDFDVVGLWEDKPEPFDLERALDGELVKYSDKPCYVYQSKVTGLFWVEAQDGSFVDNDTSFEAISEQGMWKEPEIVPFSPNVTVTLPRALREPQDELWFIDTIGYVKSSYNKNIPPSAFKQRPYFGSEQDVKAWWEAMMNSRGI